MACDFATFLRHSKDDAEIIDVRPSHFTKIIYIYIYYNIVYERNPFISAAFPSIYMLLVMYPLGCSYLMFLFCCSEDGKLSCGYSSFRGKRASMEDFFDLKTSKIDGQTVCLFGIFDG